MGVMTIFSLLLYFYSKSDFCHIILNISFWLQKTSIPTPYLEQESSYYLRQMVKTSSNEASTTLWTFPDSWNSAQSCHNSSYFCLFKGLYQAEKKADYANSPATADLLVIVKNVDEMRRLTPQLMLDVKAIALPLIPPGNISLNTNHDTEIK